MFSKYSLVSANDEQNRDPANWTLYGSTDGLFIYLLLLFFLGITYIQIDSKTNIQFSLRKQKQTYTLGSVFSYFFIFFNFFTFFS
jgi:cellobiose phosphorylase